MGFPSYLSREPNTRGGNTAAQFSTCALNPLY